MKTLANSVNFDHHDPAKFRLQVLRYGQKHGWKATCEAYGVSKSSYFRWRDKLKKSRGKLASLIPKKTAPQRVRQPMTSTFVLAQIKKIRDENGNLGKEKIKVFVDEYCKRLGIDSVSVSTIGRVINRYHLYTKPYPQAKRVNKYAKYRVKSAPRVSAPGLVEVDCVAFSILGKKCYFVCLIDIYTRIASVTFLSSPPSSQATKNAFINFQKQLPFPITNVQTDNGSEFLGKFNQYLQEENIPHQFTYPHSPKINGVVERFNRTLQDEFLKVSRAIKKDYFALDKHLQKWLNWYNNLRPHYSLKYMAPIIFFNNYHSQK
jgi:transposase InsO family protein